MTSLGRAFVTGATGFVGSAVARALLRRGWDLRLLARRGSDTRNLDGLPAERVEGDLQQPDSIAPHLQGCQALFHVAADYRIWVPDPEAMMRANVDGTVALLRAARDAGIGRIVYCSSVAALGLIGDGTPSTEDAPNSEAKTVGVYKKSKYRAEQAVLRLVAEEGVRAVIVNPSTPIGPRDIKPTPTGRMIRDAALGRMPAYLDTGLNVVHVDDVAEGHLLAMEHGIPGERYILGGTDMHLADILAVVARETGRAPPRIRLNETVLWPVALASEALARLTGNEPLVTRDHLRMARKKMFFSSAKARAAFGWSPRPAEDAIRDAVAWFRDNDPAFAQRRTAKGTSA